MVNANRLIANIVGLAVACHAIRIEGDVSRELLICFRRVCFLESPHGRIHRRTASAREPHECYPRWVDTRMLCQKIKCAVRIDNHEKPAKVRSRGNTTARKTVDSKRRNPQRVEFTAPLIWHPSGAAYTRDTVQENHCWEFFGSCARDAEFTGKCDRLTILACQQFSILERHGGEGIVFDACHLRVSICKPQS